MRRSLPLAALLAFSPWTAAFAVDGAEDLTFSTDGEVTWTDGGSVIVEAVATKPSAAYAVGTIDLAGEAPALHWKGFNHGGGTLDQGCAQASDTLVTQATESNGLAGLIDSSGNLVVGGWAAISGTETTRRALITRFDLSGPGCDLDDAFSANGWALFDDVLWCDDESCDVVDLVEIRPVTGAVLAPRIVALLRSETSALTARLFLLALTSSGAIDTGFDGNGWKEVVEADLGALSIDAALEVDGRGRLYVHGARYDPDGIDDRDVVLFRFHANGALDTSFVPGGGALVFLDHGPDDTIDTVPEGFAIAANGIPVSVSQKDADNAYTYAYLEETLQNDLTVSFHVVEAVATQGNGRVVNVGEKADGADGFTLERRLLDGLPMDQSFGSFGYYSHDIDLGGSNAERAATIEIWNGRPLVAGTASTASGLAGFLLRTENAFVFADSFEQGTAALWSSAIGLDFPE